MPYLLNVINVQRVTCVANDLSTQNSLTMAPHLLTDASGYRCTCTTLMSQSLFALIGARRAPDYLKYTFLGLREAQKKSKDL